MDFYANMIINWRIALCQLSAVSSTHNLSTRLGDSYREPRLIFQKKKTFLVINFHTFLLPV